MLGREAGTSSAENQGAGKRPDAGAGPGKKRRDAYLRTLKVSRPEQAHEIMPNRLYYDYDYWL